MNMRDKIYPILHLDTNKSKGTVFLLLFYILVTVESKLSLSSSLHQNQLALRPSLVKIA